MWKTSVIVVLLGLVGYWWPYHHSQSPAIAEIITMPYSSLENKTKVEEAILNSPQHNSFQFPLALLQYVSHHKHIDTIPIAGWHQLVNVSAKTELGQSFMMQYDVETLVLMKEDIEYYNVDFSSAQIELEPYTEPFSSIIDRHFSNPPTNFTHNAIPLTPNDFILDTAHRVRTLSQKQQEFLTSNITEYRYFKEGSLLGVSGLAHYDLRFFNGRIEPFDRVSTLHRIVRAWARFTHKAGIRTWIGHGSLLGYYFNGLILPWDDDLDVQVTAESFWKLVGHNQTLVMDFNDVEAIGSYLIDVNPWFISRDRNPENKIDARFIDLETGLYIDITTLTSELDPPTLMDKFDEEERAEFYKVFNPYHDEVATEIEVHEEEIQNAVNTSLLTRSLVSCKDLHFYTVDELTPLIPTAFEGEILYVPNNINNLLLREYKRKSLYLLDYKGFTFDRLRKVWTHPHLRTEYNGAMADFINLHYKIKQTTFKRHIFAEENLVRFDNFKVDPQICNLTSEM